MIQPISHYIKILSYKIFFLFNFSILKELMHCKKQINDGLEKLHQERVSEATKHKLALQTLEAKNEYNTNFASSILHHNKNINDIRLVK